MKNNELRMRFKKAQEEGRQPSYQDLLDVLDVTEAEVKEDVAEAEVTEAEVKEVTEADVKSIFRNFGMPAHIKGYRYTVTAVIMVAKEFELIHAVTKILYPTIAKIYGTTASRVERAIRHAIEVTWDKENQELLKLFGSTASQGRKPTNSEFIALIADQFSPNK